MLQVSVRCDLHLKCDPGYLPLNDPLLGLRERSFYFTQCRSPELLLCQFRDGILGSSIGGLCM